MRAVAYVAVAVAGSLSVIAPAQPAEPPAIVIPGKPGVPVIINGYDASYAVVEGDFGLDRPGQVPVTIISRPLFAPESRYYGTYFPAYGRQPGYGRLEIEPPANRRLPPPAQRFHRSWTSQSDPLPDDVDPPAQSPALIVAPQINGRRQTARRHRD
jgi:hypothetical protein